MRNLELGGGGGGGGGHDSKIFYTLTIIGLSGVHVNFVYMALDRDNIIIITNSDKGCRHS